jgi:hypothetical protein
MAYLKDELVANVAERLAAHETITSRRQTFLWRWLTLKKAGLGAGAVAELTTGVCQGAADDLLRVDATEAGERNYYQPFSGDWVKGRGSTNWAIQVLYTTTTSRQTNWERGVWTPPQQDPQNPGVWPFRGLEVEEYLNGLHDALQGAVPILDLAVWRYRATEVPDMVTDANLTQRLIGEYRLTRGELESAFVDDGSGLLETLVAHDEDEAAGGAADA